MIHTRYYDGEHVDFTATTREPCKHNRGFYYSLKLWPITCRVFVCEECHEILDKDRKRVLR